MPSIVALIPARGGSKRVPRKNIRLLAGHPLIAYTIAAAKQSGIFTDIVVSSDDDAALVAAHLYGATVLLRRPAEFATDESPDIQWVMHAMERRTEDCFSILRPTSPFRTADTIRRAWVELQDKDCDSIRAVERWYGPHPGKMWEVWENLGDLEPVMKRSFDVNGLQVQSHSMPTQLLGPVYVQNASLEMAFARVLRHPKGPMSPHQSIHGYPIAPFFTEGMEGFDINTEEDWALAELLAKHYLPSLEVHADTV